MKAPALRTRLFIWALLLTGAFAVYTSRRRAQADDLTPAKLDALEKLRAELYAKKLYDETGYERLARPVQGEWLARFEESGQNEADYKEYCPNKRDEKRSKIYVMEVGDLGKRAKEAQPAVREFMKAFFQLDVKKLEPIALPKKAWDAERQQANGDFLLRLFSRDVPDDALASVGLLDIDLYTQGLNFVFGLGSLEQKVGVYSFTRFGWGDVPEPLYRARAFRLVAHEVGHVLSLEHCVYYKCLMNGANSLVEDDATPLHVCPVCLAKLQHNVGFDALAREKALGAIYEREGIAAEASWSKGAVARLEAKAKTK